MCTDRIQSATGTVAAQKLALSLPASHTNINEITNLLVPKLDKSIYNTQIITGEILSFCFSFESYVANITVCVLII